jgi:hypothetical protein
MPREFNTIQRPDLILRLQQFFGIRQSNIAPTLSPTVQAVALVADLTQRRGDRQLTDSPTVPLICGAFKNVGPVAGQFSRIKLRNPDTSGVTVKIRSLYLDSLFSLGYIMRDAVDLAVGGQLGLDTSFRPPGSLINFITPKCLLSSDTNAAPLADQVFFLQASAAGSKLFNALDPIAIIAPGDSFTIQSSSANVQLICSLAWEEFPVTN